MLVTFTAIRPGATWIEFQILLIQNRRLYWTVKLAVGWQNGLRNASGRGIDLAMEDR